MAFFNKMKGMKKMEKRKRVNNSRLFILFLRILANLAKSIDINEKTLYNR